MHYTANGKAATDRTRVGLQFSKDPSPREVRVTHFMNGTLSLPAGSPDTRVDADISFVADAVVWGIFPHTHVRGKRWEYVLELPDGSKKNVLSVPRYDFNWQTYYMFAEPLQVPKGSKLISSAWYDNSPANKSNPDPKVDVKWGDQTWEEMQYTGLLFSPGYSADVGSRGRPLSRRSAQFLSAVAIVGFSAIAAAHDPIKTRVTWNGDIARIVEARCVSCHGAEARGTMSLASYEAARPWARAIKEEVLTRRMPTWQAARGYGDFSNDPSLSPFQIALVVAWADGGAPRGTDTDLKSRARDCDRGRHDP